MKFQVDRDVMADAVLWASRTLPTKSTQPLLTGMHLVAEKSGLILSGSDADVSARANLKADVIEAGTVLIPGRLLADITRSLPSAVIDFSIEGNRAKISCGRSSFTIPTMPVAEYPPLPTMPGVSGTVTGTDFATAISGVKIDVDGAVITLAATDRYRLAVRELNWSPASTSINTHALVPAKFLSESSKSLSHSEAISLAFATGNEGLIGIEGSGRQTTSRLLAADFPKYQTLLPTESTTVAQISTSALVESVKRVSLVLEREAPIRVHFTNGEAVITGGGGSGELAEAKEFIECTLTGEELTIAFNHQFLLDGLSATDSSVAVVSMTTAIRPAVISGASDFGAQPDDSFKYLLMPIRQQ
ncbi:MAG: DNA polymerase III subunit beta [Actinobacteria bacterium]|nr:DNA polymerase III subunit beta [Actinomycetota bacterium]